MKMCFIHAVVFNKDEFENGLYNTSDWGDLTDGDYVVHCLYSLDNEQIVILEDNTHQPVETMIENFIEGIEYTGFEAYVDKAYIVMSAGENSYCDDEVKAHIQKNEYVEVV